VKAQARAVLEQKQIEMFQKGKMSDEEKKALK
jgi:hypothetical protein